VYEDAKGIAIFGSSTRQSRSVVFQFSRSILNLIDNHQWTLLQQADQTESSNGLGKRGVLTIQIVQMELKQNDHVLVISHHCEATTGGVTGRLLRHNSD
jgi:hypothetical protein